MICGTKAATFSPRSLAARTASRTGPFEEPQQTIPTSAFSGPYAGGTVAVADRPHLAVALRVHLLVRGTATGPPPRRARGRSSGRSRPSFPARSSGRRPWACRGSAGSWQLVLRGHARSRTSCTSARRERLLALPDGLVGEDEDRELELLGDVERVDGRVEAVLDVRAREDDAGASPCAPKRAWKRSDCSLFVGFPVDGPPRCTFTMTDGTSAIAASPSISVISERPGPDVAVMDFTPAKDAPMTAPIAASSSSVWTTEPPTSAATRRGSAGSRWRA